MCFALLHLTTSNISFNIELIIEVLSVLSGIKLEDLGRRVFFYSQRNVCLIDVTGALSLLNLFMLLSKLDKFLRLFDDLK